MSLFTVRDIWTFQSGVEESEAFSPGAFAVGNVDNEDSGTQKIVIGTLSGLLRIIGPPVNQSGSATGSLLAEFHLGAPILQIVLGRFVGGSTNIHLGILQPQKLGVYLFAKLDGQVEHGSQYKVSLLYEHRLKRHPFNMCSGPFGQKHSGSGRDHEESKMRDFFCIQSLDGTLSFFEQEVITFSCYLPDFLLPGPFAFLPDTNSFLTVNSAWTLQCFRYSTLVSIKDMGTSQVEETTVGRRLTPDWFWSLGEEPMGELEIIRGCNQEPIIVLLTLRFIFCFAATGELLWSKRLEFSPVGCIAYLNGLGETITGIVSDSNPGTFYVFNSIGLKWAAKLPFAPKGIKRAQVEGFGFGLVLASGNGEVGVYVLGTQPSLFMAPPIESRELDYMAAEKELMYLRKIISDSGEQNFVSTREGVVDIKMEFEGQKTIWSEKRSAEATALIATVKILCRVRVNDVRVSIYSPTSILSSRSSVYIGDIVGRHSYTVEFSVETDIIPPDLEIEIHLFYSSDQGTPHCLRKKGIRIPFFMLSTPAPMLIKDGEAKLTFALNKPVIDLMSLYNDFDWNPDINASSLTFNLPGGESLSILASTKGNSEQNSRYRIQSNSLAIIHLGLRDFIDRLNRKFGRDKGSFELSFPTSGDSEIPLINEFFREIDNHIFIRRRELQIKDDIEGRATQLRGIQRRLLIRFRDKNILPMTELETLLEGSLEQIFDTMNFLDENQIEKERSECSLNGSINLILLVTSLSIDKPSDDVNFLRHSLCPHLEGLCEDCGWEECVYAGLSHLKTGEIVSPPPGLAQLDIAKLRKLIKWILEKYKTGELVPPRKSKSNAPAPEELVGNELVERMMSARSRTERQRKKRTECRSLPPIPEPSQGDGEGPELLDGNSTSLEKTLDSQESRPIKKILTVTNSYDEKGSAPTQFEPYENSHDDFW